MKNTKKALLLSCLTLLLCLSMLVGSTFAWFTDSASTSVNSITSGTLDVVLEMWDGKNWVNAEGGNLDFIKADGSKEILWEPGCTYVLPKLRIRNNGNLALKFDVAITGIAGDAKLNEVIDWTYSYTSDMAVGADPNDKTEVTIYKHGNGHPLLPADKADHVNNINYAYLTISGHMQETAGNEYQDLTIGGISITVLATQYTYENDSYNHLYDINATYVIEAPSYFNNDGEDHVVDLSKADYLISGTDLQKDNVFATIKVEGAGTSATITGQGTVKVTAEPGISNAMAVWARNGAQITIEDGTYILERAEGNTEEVEMIYASGNGSTITINGGTFKCNHPAKTLNIHNGSNAYIYIYGGSFWEFNPANHEDAGKVIIPEGYKVVSEEKADGTWYTVVAE